MAILGIVGIVILVNPGVAGDLREDWEDMEAASVRLVESFRGAPEVTEAVLSLREKSPIVRDKSPVESGMAEFCNRDPIRYCRSSDMLINRSLRRRDCGEVNS